jgi:hypothetical protein
LCQLRNSNFHINRRLDYWHHELLKRSGIIHHFIEDCPQTSNLFFIKRFTLISMWLLLSVHHHYFFQYNFQNLSYFFYLPLNYFISHRASLVFINHFSKHPLKIFCFEFHFFCLNSSFFLVITSFFNFFWVVIDESSKCHDVYPSWTYWTTCFLICLSVL